MDSVPIDVKNVRMTAAGRRRLPFRTGAARLTSLKATPVRQGVHGTRDLVDGPVVGLLTGEPFCRPAYDDRAVVGAGANQGDVRGRPGTVHVVDLAARAEGAALAYGDVNVAAAPVQVGLVASEYVELDLG